MTLGDVITCEDSKNKVKVITIENNKVIHTKFEFGNNLRRNFSTPESEILSGKDYSIFRGILRKKMCGAPCYEFFEKIGFVPIDMKENYLMGEKIYKEQNGHYVSEGIN